MTSVSAQTLFDAVVMDQNRTSDVMAVCDATMLSVLVSSPSGTHVGDVTGEVSLDRGTTYTTAVQTDGSNSACSVSASNGSALEQLWHVQLGGATHFRVAYAFTSGTGALNAVASKRW